VAYAPLKHRKRHDNPNLTSSLPTYEIPPDAPVSILNLPKGSTVKLTFAIGVVALVLIAGTTTICMSGAVNDHTTEYGGVHATIEQLFNPHAKICR
jgi:hypothetical protein